MNLAAVRAAIPALSQSVYLNTGTFGPSPSVVLDEVRRALDLVEQHGAYSPVVRQAVEQEAYEQARLEAAQLLGASPDEITLTRNTSDGVNILAFGLDWHAGDEVVITDQEHPSGVLPWLVLTRRFGVVVRVVQVDSDPDILLERFEAEIAPRTRLVFASHVTSLAGVRLPVTAICRVAHAQGALAVVDGAHAVGQFPVDVREIGCDGYVTSGHKWLLGPQGASFAYVAREHLDTFQPSWTGWGAQVAYTLAPGAQAYMLLDSARRFEFGTKHWPIFPGLARAIRFVRDEVTLPDVQAHVQPMAARLKAALAALGYGELLTPAEPERCAGAVCLALPNGPADIRERLWERHRVIAAYDPSQRGLRLSVAFFTTEAEVDAAVEAIADCLGAAAHD